jgi:hypothetical protein
MAIKDTKAIRSKAFQNVPKQSVQRPSKIYQNWGFGLETNHLATMHGWTTWSSLNFMFPLYHLLVDSVTY